MRLGVAALCALLLAAAAVAQPDVEDLPPVDELVGQLISGELSPQDVVDMTPRMPEQYLQDVKHSLPDDLKQKVVELVHQRMSGPAADPEPAEAEEEDEDYTYDYEEDETFADEDQEDLEEDDYLEEDVNTEEEPAAADTDQEQPQAELAPVEEPIEKQEDSGRLRAAPGLRAGPMEDEGIGAGGGGGGVSEGGVLPVHGSETPLDDLKAARLLIQYSRKEKEGCLALYNNAYNFYTTDHTLGPNKVGSEVSYLKLWRQFSENSTDYDLSGLDRTDLVGLFMLLRNPGVSALDDTQLNDLTTALTNLETKFASARVCDFYDDRSCDLSLYKDIRVKLASSTDRDELEHYWLTWRGLVGRNSGKLYADYVRLLDDAAKIKNADSDAWSLMTYPYRHGNTPDILSLLEELWERDISPIYGQLHSYARLRLRQRYGTDAVPAEGSIPAHLFGSHEADDWSALQELMKPFDNATALDFHGQCVQKGVDVGILKRVASELYSKLGLNETSASELTASRMNVAAPDADSVLFLPRVLDGCHSGQRSAVGIYPTNTTLSDYVELIELFGTMQQYKERAQALVADNIGFPYKNRVGYNAYGLDLAIGGARALAAITPEGLKQKLGFQMFDSSDNGAMNLQMTQALKLLPRLAASMAALRWQSEVMSGRISEGEYNDKWWEYKREYQGVSPPEERDNTQFDAFADGTLTLPNYHLRRVLGGIAMFSVHKYHCKMYGDASQPISECAIFDNKQLGENIREVLVSGNSKPLRDQLQALTGQRELSAAALVEQMQPLADWLIKYNEEHPIDGDGVGENTQTIAIIVGVVIAVVVLGLVVFFVVARRKQKHQDYKSAPTREPAQHA